MNDLFVVVVGGGGGVSHRCSITTSSIEELEKKARVVSFERDERERESDHAHIYLKIVIQNANTTQQDIISIIESRIASSSRTSPAATRFTTCSGNLAISFTSTIFFLFIVSFCLVKGAFVCVDFVEKEKRGVSQLLKP